jgi:hypothetical protein
MKPVWERATRVCSTIDLQPDLLAALRAYIELHELEGAEAQALVCWQTESRRLKKPSMMERLARATAVSVLQAVIVTPTRLLWADLTEKREASAHSELLAGMQVTDYEKGPGFDLIPDHGVEVYGIHGQQGRVGTVFFGMGEGPDADKARTTLKAAVRAANGEGPAPTPPSAAG